MPGNERRLTLNLRLLRTAHDISDAFGPKFSPGSVDALTETDWNEVEGAKLYVGQIYSKKPDWAAFLGSSATDVDLLTAGAGAVIFLPLNGRFIAVCFGQAHLALKDDAFERQFGMKVTLNTVPIDSLRTLDLATPDAVTFQRRVQASKDSKLSDFGVDMLRDLARVAGGTPDDASFGHFVAGKDSLSIMCSIAPERLQEKCKEVLTHYKTNRYQKTFPWVDNLKIVDEANILKSLDREVEKALKDLIAKKKSELHLAPPEIVNYLDGTDLHYNGIGSGASNKIFTTLSIDEYVDELRAAHVIPDMQFIRERHRVAARDGVSGKFHERWKLFDCFVFEATLGSKKTKTYYVLFSGDWYEVKKQFKDSVEDYFRKVPKISVIGKTSCKNERELIADLEAGRNDLVKLDQQKVNPSDVRYGNLEPCDFFSDTRQFIHLKDGHSSGPISHLWSQGVVSADAFVRDEKFRSDVRAIVKNLSPRHAKLLPLKNQKVDRGSFTVVYGIMRAKNKSGSLDIPFFSKVSFQASAEKISQLGIPISVEIIEKV